MFKIAGEVHEIAPGKFLIAHVRIFGLKFPGCPSECQQPTRMSFKIWSKVSRSAELRVGRWPFLRWSLAIRRDEIR